MGEPILMGKEMIRINGFKDLSRTHLVEIIQAWLTISKIINLHLPKQSRSMHIFVTATHVYTKYECKYRLFEQKKSSVPQELSPHCLAQK